jgi:hypothetical protein
MREFIDAVYQYPFLNMIYEDRINQHHYMSFLFPDDSQAITQFKKSITEVGIDNFTYWSLQEGNAAGFSNNTELLNEEGWSCPEVVSHNECLPDLPLDFQPMSSRVNVDKSLTITDLKIASVLSGKCRATSKEISNILESSGFSISSSTVYRRRKRLLAKNELTPFAMWHDHSFSSHLRVEITCSQVVQNRFLAAALMLPNTAYYVTNDILVLWVNVPIEHISRYVEFFKERARTEDIEHIRLVLGKTWQGSRPLTDVVKEWNYSPGGFSIKGLDINPDMTDYIQ